MNCNSIILHDIHQGTHQVYGFINLTKDTRDIMVTSVELVTTNNVDRMQFQSDVVRLSHVR